MSPDLNCRSSLGPKSSRGGWSAGRRYLFLTQKVRDVETGLDYFQARYYSSSQGRFASVDPENTGAELNYPQTWNGYSYGLNSPLVLTDPDGRKVVICDMNGACSSLSDEDANKYNFNLEYQRQNGFWVRQGKIFDANGNQIGTYQNICCDWLQGSSNERVVQALQDDRTWERAAVAAVWNYTIGRVLRSIFGGRPSSANSSTTPGLPRSALKPLGRGSTGRSTPNNLKEQIAMEQAMSNPAAGAVVPLKKGMTDSRWPATDGWVKMRQNVNGVEVHYVKNTRTGEVDDFKFKD